MLPQQSDIERWLQAADVLVSGSHEDTEGLSRVLFEAMACGAVPVATDIQGNREALSPETGVLVAERSPEAMARAVSELMAAPAERLAAMRAAGLQRARERFDIRRHARQVEAFCLEIHRRNDCARGVLRLRSHGRRPHRTHAVDTRLLGRRHLAREAVGADRP